jgi:carboxypeptidase C (cathepsin A)
VAKEEEKSEKNREINDLKEPEDNIVQSHHNVNIDGKEINYTVTAGTMVLLEEEEEDEKSKGEKAKASIFFVAYTRDETEESNKRPITFSFNGGPGSSSVWLHLGVLGPRKIELDDDGYPLPPPYRLIDNNYSLLDVTDLVFIDPVSTGFSRAVPGEKPKEFHGFKKDIESVGDFIRLYTTRYQRWGSPKFLIGESYGTTRASGLAGYLQDRHGYFLNGIMFISTVLDFQTLLFNSGNDLPYILFLPTYTATAWYHERLDEELQIDLRKTLDQAEAFALGDYASALLKGSSLQADEHQQIVSQLARFTGLSTEYVEQSNLRISIHRYVKELLRSKRLTVGRLDSRFTGVDRDAAGEVFEFDPSYAAILGPFTATLNDYIRGELNFEKDIPYEILTDRVHPWSFEEHQNEYVYVAETLRKAMVMNPHLKVFVANGYFDLATPYLATAYTFNHLSLEPEMQKQISMGFYQAGHMMYIHKPSLAQLKEDLQGFIISSLPV